MLNRRGALKLGFFGTGLLAVGGGLSLASRASKLRQPARPLIALTTQEFSVMAAIAERVLPAQGPFPSPSQLEVAHKVDELFAIIHPGLAHDLKLLIHMFESGVTNFVFDGRSRPFTQMSPEDQDAALRDWQHSRIPLRRTGYKALRGLVVASYFGRQELDAAVGYPGPPPGSLEPLRHVPPATKLGGGS